MSDQLAYRSEIGQAADKLTRSIAAAFLLLLLVVIAWSGYSLWQNKQLSESLYQLNEYHVKVLLYATDLLESAYNRHQSMIAQVITDDPFERDEFQLQYYAWGNRVGDARRELKALKLDQFGTDNLAQQDVLIPEIVKAQDRLVDLAAQERIPEAMEILRLDLRELDAQFDAIVQDLRRHSRDRVADFSSRAAMLANDMGQLSITLGIAVILFVIGLGIGVYRTMRQRGQAISRQAQELEQAGLQLIHDATHDALTGLPNRRLFFEQLAQSLKRMSRGSPSVAVVYVDVDEFKPINDTYGHAVGDVLLQVIAERIGSGLNDLDLAARLGGDEFALILQTPHLLDIDAYVTELRLRVERAAELSDGLIMTPKVSVGYAFCPTNSCDMDELMAQADEAMYCDKQERQGR